MKKVIGRLHKKFYAEDKMLRHAILYLEIISLTLIIVFILTGKAPDITELLTVLFCMFLPDLDGIMATFFRYRSNPVAKQTADYFLRLDFRPALANGTVHRKQLNTLLLHNFIGYSLIGGLCLGTFRNGYPEVFWIFLALLGHLTFDILDDIYQMGHVRNWLWPFHVVFPANRLFKSVAGLPVRQMLGRRTVIDPIDHMVNVLQSEDGMKQKL